MAGKRQRFTDEDWRGFLPGPCRPARKLLPYLDRFQQQWVSAGFPDRLLVVSLVEIYRYDYYMCTKACLVLLIASSGRADDMRWLEDVELMSSLKALDSLESRAYECENESGGAWLEHCMAAMARMNAMLFVDGDSGLDLWIGREGRTCERLGELSRLVDGCRVQMVRQAFYIATGRRTQQDGLGWISKEDGVSEIPIGCNEVLCWCQRCPIADSSECDIGGCAHFTGLLPVVGVRRL